jgi:hypothetical protein
MNEKLADSFSAKRMKKPAACVAALALLLAICAPARGVQPLPLAWDASSSSTVTGYRLYYGTNATNFEYSVDVGTNTSYVSADLEEGQTNYFAVAAYNAQDVESPLSNLISYNVPRLLSVKAKTGPKSPVVIRSGIASGLPGLAPETGSRSPDGTKSGIIPGLLNIAPKAGPRSPVIMNFSVVQGRTYKVQASANLQTWSTIWQTTATNNESAEFQDNEGSNLKMRFYRLVWE